MTNRQLKFSEAIHEAIDICLERDRNIYLMGLGVPDPIGVFGTTKGLQEKHGKKRVFDMPVAENAMSGVALGSCLVGMRPIMTHMRLEFAMTAMDQICNQAAKWHYMFGGQSKVPLTIRMLVGRGWGQGPQHSQSLHAWFAHIPGLKVVMPSTPYDAKGLLIASIEDDNPVIFFEHRWLHNIHGPVPEGHYTVPLGEPRLVTEGGDVTIVAASYATLESIKAARELEREGIKAEVIDLRTLVPRNDDGDPCLGAEDRPAGGRGPGDADGWVRRRDRGQGDRAGVRRAQGRSRSRRRCPIFRRRRHARCRIIITPPPAISWRRCIGRSG